MGFLGEIAAPLAGDDFVEISPCAFLDGRDGMAGNQLAILQQGAEVLDEQGAAVAQGGEGVGMDGHGDQGRSASFGASAVRAPMVPRRAFRESGLPLNKVE
ncbi:hypothetical protein SDC9_191147 [bioreactor metagenome]|uniref:Uncharacterized protein n=1 Tax=bioreactor metagenome TaxID=1076179 RepID=A0A645HX55_9ZZZZ